MDNAAHDNTHHSNDSNGSSSSDKGNGHHNHNGDNAPVSQHRYQNGHSNGYSNGSNGHSSNGHSSNGHSSNGHTLPLRVMTAPEVTITTNGAGSAPSTLTGTPRLCRLADLLNAWEVDAAAAFDARVNNRPRGPVTGLAKIDKELGAALSPGLHIVHGQPGAGKTAFALQIAASCGCSALFVTCEMGPLELLRRLTARITETYLGRLKSGEYRPVDSTNLARQAIAEVPHLALVDATQAYASPLYLRDCAQVVKGESPHLLIVVDSIHSWAEGAVHEASEYDALNAALAALRTLSHQLNCAVLVVAERNRDSMKSGGLSAGAGTRKLEYGAETVIDLQRDAEAREDTYGEIEVKAKFVKNRNGMAGKVVALRFHGAMQSFTEV